MKRSWVALCVLGFMAVSVRADTGSVQKIATARGPVREFTGPALKTIAFPIGGLGTGNITLGGRGNIQELEIFNRPRKGLNPDMTFFSLWARAENGKPVAKILERRPLPPYVGWMGFPRNQLAGVSRFSEAVFRGEFPFANLKLEDENVPVSVALEAFSPFIPLDPDRSSIPGAVFNWRVSNPGRVPVSVSLAFSMQNPIQTKDAEGHPAFGQNLNRYLEEPRFRGVMMNSERAAAEDLEAGSIVLATAEKELDVQTRWYRGGWWDSAHVFWDDFADDGRLQNVRDAEPSDAGKSDVATLLAYFRLEPGEEKIIPFYLTWVFPNRENYWNRGDYWGEKEVDGRKFKNHYAGRFQDAREAAEYLIANIGELTAYTRRFHDLLFHSAYPPSVIDAVSSQASSLQTNLVLRTEDGGWFGFEGVTDDSGCCPMNCTHVWNYEQTQAFLFPSLERSMRETDFLHNTFDNGYQTFRTLLPLGPYWWRFKPCADGQMGNVVRAYREWKYSGDTAWLRKLWPRIRAALEFAWKGVGQVDDDLKWQQGNLLLPWDPDKDGVMEGEQHNTYDIEFYGPNTMTGSLYLAALKAGSEMAAAMGEKDRSREYLMLFRSGSERYDAELWNGEYFSQTVDVLDGLIVPDQLRSPVAVCRGPECKGKQSPGGKRSALEAGQVVPKYQYGDGCLSDQLLGQYLAHVAGLGYILEPSHVDQTMASIFRHNFKQDLNGFSNVQRVYALNDEAGLLLCSWPRGNRPALPFVYSDEVWTGIEYQVAAGLIYSGHTDEGLTLVKAVRDRYRGFDRNPWDELECGHHYARAMASWAVLLALSGYRYDGVEHFMSFAPRINRQDFSSFWSCGTGWGGVVLTDEVISLKVEFGSLSLAELGLPGHYPKAALGRIRFGERTLEVDVSEDENGWRLRFPELMQLRPGDEISISLSGS